MDFRRFSSKSNKKSENQIFCSGCLAGQAILSRWESCYSQGRIDSSESSWLRKHNVKNKKRPKTCSVKSDFDENLHGKNYMPKKQIWQSLRARNSQIRGKWRKLIPQTNKNIFKNSSNLELLFQSVVYFLLESAFV